MKPCPFCGNEPVVLAGIRGWKVECSKRHTTCPINGRTHYHDQAGDAVEQWNTRQEPRDGYGLLPEEYHHGHMKADAE